MAFGVGTTVDPEDPFFAVRFGADWNACIGKQGAEENYVDGYMEAALELASAVIDKNQPEKRDTLAMPILYNARHAVELTLKFVIGRLVGAGVLADPHPKNHNIKSLWDKLDRARLGDIALRGFVADLKIFVDSLHAVDEDGQQLRYPETQGGEKSLEDKALIDLEHVRGSLVTLQVILQNLRYRALHFASEQASGTFTRELSRRDLMAITEVLPPKSAWTTDAFTNAKVAIQSRFGLSSNQFSKAIDVIKVQRHMAGMVGIETDLEHLTAADLIFVVGEWMKVPPQLEAASGSIGVSYFERDLSKIAARLQGLKDMVGAVHAALPPEKIADLEAVYYIGNQRLFSEEYHRLRISAARELEVGADPWEKISHLLQKSDFPKASARGVDILGCPSLGRQIRAMRDDFAG